MCSIIRFDLMDYGQIGNNKEESFDYLPLHVVVFFYVKCVFPDLHCRYWQTIDTWLVFKWCLVSVCVRMVAIIKHCKILVYTFVIKHWKKNFSQYSSSLLESTNEVLSFHSSDWGIFPHPYFETAAQYESSEDWWWYHCTDIGGIENDGNYGANIMMKPIVWLCNHGMPLSCTKHI